MANGLNSHHSINLPILLSTFIGRSKEINKVKQLILGNRLVTLTGAGGSGKTRLSLEIGHQLAEQYNNNVWFIELAALTDPSHIPQKIVSVLELPEQQEIPCLDLVVKYLSRGRALLIMDNCEHLVLESAEVSAHLLKKCPDLRILATSRERLGITGEVTLLVPPLSLPKQHPWRDPASPQHALDLYTKSESVQLFTARAVANSPEFELTPSNGPWVAEICRRLDGLPLAIELAAAQVRSLTVREIARRLDNRFILLTGGSRTAHPRQQTLEATLDWSYDLLSVNEQIVLNCLSVFVGGATIDAAEFVCAAEDIDTGQVFKALSNLVNKSLVVVDKLEPGETRYRLLETIREYAHKKLTQSKEWAATRNRHLEFYLRLAEEAEPKIRGPEEIIWFERLDLEHDSLREALRWALEAKNAEAGLRLASSLGFFWFVRGHLREGIDWLEKVLVYRKGASKSSIAHALMYLGGLLNNRKGRDLIQTSQILEESLKLYQELEDKTWIAFVLNLLGINATAQGKYAEAINYLDRSLAIRRELGDPWFIAHTLQNYAFIFLNQGEYERAKNYTEETLIWFQRAEYQRGIVRTMMDLAKIAQISGDSEQAEASLIGSLSQLFQFGDLWSAAYALEGLASIAVERDELKHAAKLFGAAKALREAVGMPLQEFEFEHKIYEGDVETLRESLTEREFTRTWMEGQTMTVEQIVEFVSIRSKKTSSCQKEKERFAGLTEREQEAAVLIAQGLSNREIAESMTVTLKTVEAHVTRILRKLNFDSRVQVATWVVENDIS